MNINYFAKINSHESPLYAILNTNYSYYSVFFMNPNSSVTLEKIVSLGKRRGFFYPSCEIYGGINGVYDKGPLGVLLEKNVIAFWKRHMRESGYDMVQMDGALLGNEAMWTASGHVENFHDPLIDCKACKVRYREDDVDVEKVCQRCGIKDWGAVRQFHMMFKTALGAANDSSSTAYLRPETAQNIFVQFKNIYTTSRVKIPFGVTQVGKSFRNEITPRQFLFRMREFSQMEMEFFCTPDNAREMYEFWLARRLEFYKTLGWDDTAIRTHHHSKEELSHYSDATADVEFNFPFGWKELEGIAYRTNFDLTQHSKHSGKDLSVFDDKTQSSYVPHVVECSVGVERLMLAILCESYYEEAIKDEIRVVLRLPHFLAPIQIALLPLTKNEEEEAHKLYREILKTDMSCQYDDSGSIGKRYRRYDEIGVPYCVTIDASSREKQTATIRMRDSMKQETVKLSCLVNRLRELLSCIS